MSSAIDTIFLNKIREALPPQDSYMGKEKESKVWARGYRTSSTPLVNLGGEVSGSHLERRVHRASGFYQLLSNRELSLNNVWTGPSLIPNLIPGKEDLCSQRPTGSPGICWMLNNC